MMDVVEANDWDGIVNGVNLGEDQYANLLDILDFPMDSLEGDSVGGDWDVSKSQNLGPIPLDALTGVLPVSLRNISNGPAKTEPSSNVLNVRKSSEKKLPNIVGRNRGAYRSRQNMMSSESNASFQTLSPVSVLESSSHSCSSAKSLSIRSDIVIPARARSKRARPATVNPWLLIRPITCESRKTSNSGKNKEKKKRNLPRLTNPLEPKASSSQQAKKKTRQELDAAENKGISLQRPIASQKCSHCGVTKTPQWREGPLGRKTLCNACGVRYRSGRLFPEYRPAASPTFVPSLHSNSHKKVIEMRKKAEQQADSMEDLPMSPMPEFVPMSNHLIGYMC